MVFYWRDLMHSTAFSIISSSEPNNEIIFLQLQETSGGLNNVTFKYTKTTF